MIQPDAPQTDAEIEGDIDRYSLMLMHSPTRSERETAWQWLTEAHARRSALRVRLMEQDQGLLR